jgi:hypothetical protein
MSIEIEFHMLTLLSNCEFCMHVTIICNVCGRWVKDLIILVITVQ